MLTLLIALHLPALRAASRGARGRRSPASGSLGLAGHLDLRARATTSRSASSTSSIPSRDPLASGYQAIQSQIAIGSGGLFGKGYLEGTQTQLRFLPTQHTDFVFSVLAEEWGFVGSATVLALYLGAARLGPRDRAQLEGRLRRACSRSAWSGSCSGRPSINVAMVLGLAPVIGVPLPLFSYGGSALLAALIGARPAAQRLDAPLHVLDVLGMAPRRTAAPRPAIGAFFDMDKTLIAENSGALFMRYRYERGEVGGWELAKGLAAYLQYKLGVLDIRAWTADAMLRVRAARASASSMREAQRLVRASASRRPSTRRRDEIVREHQAAGPRGGDRVGRDASSW